MKLFKTLAATLLAALLSMTFLAAPAQAIQNPGNISLKVTATCSSPGDTVRSFYVWTPERGKIWGSTGGKSSTVNFGTFRKNVSGDTFFNWRLVCRLGGDTGEHQKRYGGAWFQTAFSYNLSTFYGRISYP